MYAVINVSVLSRYVVHESGLVKHFIWHNKEQRWTEFNYHPKELCDYYGKCGPNGICGANNADHFACTCLPSFEPKFSGNWYLRDGTGSCKRRQSASMCQSGEGFVKVKWLKLPDTSTAHVDMSLSLKESDTRAFSNLGQDLYVRVNAIDLARYRKRVLLSRRQWWQRYWYLHWRCCS
ncbi:hypothetical protein NL676_013041 [Syzygium grande]|nr:hypothetical protein NL676_013041 [Syzygium grande]